MDEEAIDGPTSSTRQREPRWLTKAFKHRQFQKVGKEEILGDGVVEPLDGRRNGLQSRLARYACGVVWVVSLVAAVVVAVLSVSKRDGEGATTHEMLLGATLVADKRAVASLAPPTPLPASSPPDSSACQPPAFCPMRYDPVCGEDDRLTYSNACEAHKKGCQGSTPGVCAPSTMPPPRPPPSTPHPSPSGHSAPPDVPPPASEPLCPGGWGRPYIHGAYASYEAARPAIASFGGASPLDANGQPSSVPIAAPMGPCPKQLPTEVAVSANNPFFTRSTDGAVVAPILTLPPRLPSTVARLRAVGCAGVWLRVSHEVLPIDDVCEQMLAPMLQEPRHLLGILDVLYRVLYEYLDVNAGKLRADRSNWVTNRAAIIHKGSEWAWWAAATHHAKQKASSQSSASASSSAAAAVAAAAAAAAPDSDTDSVLPDRESMFVGAKHTLELFSFLAHHSMLGDCPSFLGGCDRMLVHGMHGALWMWINAVYTPGIAASTPTDADPQNLTASALHLDESRWRSWLRRTLARVGNNGRFDKYHPRSGGADVLAASKTAQLREFRHEVWADIGALCDPLAMADVNLMASCAHGLGHALSLAILPLIPSNNSTRMIGAGVVRDALDLCAAAAPDGRLAGGCMSGIGHEWMQVRLGNRLEAFVPTREQPKAPWFGEKRDCDLAVSADGSVAFWTLCFSGTKSGGTSGTLDLDKCFTHCYNAEQRFACIAGIALPWENEPGKPAFNVLDCGDDGDPDDELLASIFPGVHSEVHGRRAKTQHDGQRRRRQRRTASEQQDTAFECDSDHDGPAPATSWLETAAVPQLSTAAARLGCTGGTFSEMGALPLLRGCNLHPGTNSSYLAWLACALNVVAGSPWLIYKDIVEMAPRDITEFTPDPEALWPQCAAPLRDYVRADSAAQLPHAVREDGSAGCWQNTGFSQPWACEDFLVPSHFVGLDGTTPGGVGIEKELEHARLLCGAWAHSHGLAWHAVDMGQLRTLLGAEGGAPTPLTLPAVRIAGEG